MQLPFALTHNQEHRHHHRRHCRRLCQCARIPLRRRWFFSAFGYRDKTVARFQVLIKCLCINLIHQPLYPVSTCVSYHFPLHKNCMHIVHCNLNSSIEILQNCCHLKWTGEFRRPLLLNSTTQMCSVCKALLRMDFVTIVLAIFTSTVLVRACSPPSSPWLLVPAFDRANFMVE